MAILLNLVKYPVTYAWIVTTGSVYRFTTVQNITCGTCTPRLRRQISVHVLDSIQAGYKTCFVIFNYTDVIVTLLLSVPNVL